MYTRKEIYLKKNVINLLMSKSQPNNPKLKYNAYFQLSIRKIKNTLLTQDTVICSPIKQ